jgi:hypothetical protein
MHVTIRLLTPAEDVDDAISMVEGYLETETFYDYYTTLKEESGSLESQVSKLREKQQEYDCEKLATEYLAKAQELMAKGNRSMAGFYYRRAGALYEELLNDDAVVYNIDSYDYTIPEQTQGWFVVAVDFHV